MIKDDLLTKAIKLRQAAEDSVEEYYRACRLHKEHTIDSPATPTDHRLAILVEEVGEVAHCLTYDGDFKNLRKELIQVSAMAIGWVAALDETQ